MSDLARYVWHHDLHRQAGERLFFVRLYFDPVYPDVTAALKKRLVELGIRSYHVYELVGAYDLILRLWYDGNVHDLIKALDLPEMRRADYMDVHRVHKHWALTNDASEEPPSLSALDPNLVSRLNTEINRSDGDDLSEYVRAGLVAPIRADRGVKFFISVIASIGNSASIDFDDVLLQHVTGILDAADDLVSERSIYAGDGFARLLLMGRFPGERYFEFMDEVVVKLNDQQLRQLFSARTFTAFGTRKKPLLGTDFLEVGDRVVGTREQARRDEEGSIDVDVLLERGEGQFVEVKASAFLDFDRLVHNATPSWSKLRPELVKAVCGLLNQRERKKATLIIGAVETERYRNWLDEYKDDLTEIGEFTILGLEEDNPSGNWDRYQRRLADSLAAAIEPSPLPYMTMALEEHVSRGMRKTIMRIELAPIGKPFYDRNGEKLWVRQGAQVKALGRREGDDYVASMTTRT